MPETIAVRESVGSSTTWQLGHPFDFFMSATYRTPTGRTVQMPVAVAGEHFTLQSQGMAQSGS